MDRPQAERMRLFIPQAEYAFMRTHRSVAVLALPSKGRVSLHAARARGYAKRRVPKTTTAVRSCIFRQKTRSFIVYYIHICK